MVRSCAERTARYVVHFLNPVPDDEYRHITIPALYRRPGDAVNYRLISREMKFFSLP
jgi:hypothetical protein